MTSVQLTVAERELILEACQDFETEILGAAPFGLGLGGTTPDTLADGLADAIDAWRAIASACEHLSLASLAMGLRTLLDALEAQVQSASLPLLEQAAAVLSELPHALRSHLGQGDHQADDGLSQLFVRCGLDRQIAQAVESIEVIAQRRSTEPGSVALSAEDWNARPVMHLDAALARSLEAELPVLLLRLQRALDRVPFDGAWDDVQRIAHTLKGSANTAGLKVLAVVAHLLEDWVEHQATAADALPDATWEWTRFWDALRETAQNCMAGRSAAGSIGPWYVRLHQAVLGEPPALEPPPLELPGGGQPMLASAPHVGTLPSSPTEPGATRAEGSGLKVLVARQAALAQHVAAATVHLEGLVGFQRSARASVERLSSLSAELQRRIDQLQAAQVFGPSGDAELQHLASRLSELAQDHAQGQKTLDRDLAGAREAVAGLGSEQQLAQDALWSLQAIPLASVEGRLQRIVAQVAQSTQKRVRLLLDVGSARVVQESLEPLLEVLGHLLRNAVDHGIETAEQRRASGKPEEGSIWLEAQARDGQIIVAVSDDGRGIDRQAVERRARAMGWMFPEASDDLLQVIFEPGFSTREHASLWSGRGVGLDVVRALSRAQGGEVHVRWPNRFELTWPTPGQLVAVLPVLWQAGTLYLLAGGIKAIEPDTGAGRIDAELPCARADAQAWCLRLSQGSIVRVWGIGEAQRVPLHYVPPWAVEPVGIAGICMNTKGQAQAILDPVRWVDLGAPILGASAVAPEVVTLARPAAESHPNAPLAVVVDDAVVVREHTARFLATSGWRVVQACDGVEALEAIERHSPDLVVTDLEMPRASGFDLAQALRVQPRFAALPIILITSRSGPAMLAKADEAGIDRVLMKPFVERELLAAISQLAPLPTQAAIG